MQKMKLSLRSYLCLSLVLMGSLQLTANEPVDSTEEIVVINEEVITEAEPVVAEETSESEPLKYISAGYEATIEGKIEYLQAQGCGCDKEKQRDDAKHHEQADNCIRKSHVSGVASVVKAVQGHSSNKQASAQAGYFTTHRDALFHPLIVGGTVQLDDFSVWIIEPSQSFRTLNWTTIDQIVIRQNFSIWSSYSFILENIDKGWSVEANLDVFLEPMYHTAKNHMIISIDPIQCLLWLEDGSVWSYDWWSYMGKWKPGQTVIIGINTGYNRMSEPNILINANLLQCVRASCH